ncbi:MAG: PTS sugar transporter subunit IIC, partial [Firmicutes bacterium]|nr:PTS sugar transporter subunit IIC [Bacillota bacterium]
AYWLSILIKKYIPAGIDVIIGAVATACVARLLLTVSAPVVDSVLGTIGDSVMSATDQAPILMGFVLGGIMKMVCTSPLSSMALTAMLGLTGLPMGIASIACVGGAFSNGIVFNRLGVGNKGQVLAVMIEPLTQADLVTQNAVPLYSCNFFAGGLSGIIAVSLGIINNAPGTASPVPGLLAPFAFNDPLTVVMAIAGAAAAGVICGTVGTKLMMGTKVGKLILAKTCAHQGAGA